MRRSLLEKREIGSEEEMITLDVILLDIPVLPLLLLPHPRLHHLQALREDLISERELIMISMKEEEAEAIIVILDSRKIHMGENIENIGSIQSNIKAYMRKKAIHDLLDIISKDHKDGENQATSHIFVQRGGKIIRKLMISMKDMKDMKNTKNQKKLIINMKKGTIKNKKSTKNMIKITLNPQ